jgi:hypothetical protein
MFARGSDTGEAQAGGGARPRVPSRFPRRLKAAVPVAVI